MISGIKLIFGVGLNDANYIVQPLVNGVRVHCPFYKAWKNMLGRCYDKKNHARQPYYIGCTVCNEWLTFSNFKAWMEKQDWKGKHLDKDLLVKGNKSYSPEACVFISGETNSFTCDSAATRGDTPIGVSLIKGSNLYHAYCRNPFTGKRENLGNVVCPNVAHNLWRKRKHELACQLADLQEDERVASALRTRYAS